MTKYIILVVTTCLYLSLPAYGQSSVDGRYFLGDGFSRKYLNLDMDGTFSSHTNGCTGSYNFRTGKWRLQDNIVVLDATSKSKGSLDIIEPIYTGYTAVEWSDRLYLISSNRIIDFINSINEGSEPRHEGSGWFLLREGDWENPVTGRPRLPHDYSKYFLDHPVRAKLVEKTNDLLFRIDAGENQGLLPGMVLHAQGDLFDKLEVVSIESDSALCVSRYEENRPIGTIYSTRLPDE